MNPRCPTVTLTAAERARLIELVQEKVQEKGPREGPREAARTVGVYDPRTIQNAMFGTVSRQTAAIIRDSLDRIG